MSSTEKFSLKWNDFQENTIAAFGAMRVGNKFCDVTLACEDGQQIETHKIILASSSPFFWKLLETNKHSHPLIYMRGMKYEDLVSLLDFLYFGEVDLLQDNLDSFLALAEELKLKGLAGPNAEERETKVFHKETKRVKKQKEPITQSDPLNPNTRSVISTEEIRSVVTLEENRDISEYNDEMNLDEKVCSLMTKLPGRVLARMCKVCGKEGQNTNIIDHIETHHLEGVFQMCRKCGKTLKSRHKLRMHRCGNKA